MILRRYWADFLFCFCFSILCLRAANSADDGLTWEDFDVGKAQAVMGEFSISGLTYADSLYDWENRIIEAQRLKKDDAIIARLRERQNRWRQLAAAMEVELAKEIAQAKRDANLRKIGQLLELVAFVAESFHDLQEVEAARVEAEVKGNLESNDAREIVQEGDVRIRQQQSIERFEDGEWVLLDLKRNWVEGNLPAEVLSHQAKSMHSQIEEWIQEVPTVLCNSEYGGCFEAPPIFDFPQTLINEQSLIIGPESPAETSDAIIDFVKELALEFTILPDGYRVATGTDPWTGAELDRTGPAIMLGATVVTGGAAKVAVTIAKNFKKAKKVRELIGVLEQAGFSHRPGKGSHRNYKHPEISRLITISGKKGDDIKNYQRKEVKKALSELGILDTGAK